MIGDSGGGWGAKSSSYRINPPPACSVFREQLINIPPWPVQPYRYFFNLLLTFWYMIYFCSSVSNKNIKLLNNRGEKLFSNGLLMSAHQTYWELLNREWTQHIDSCKYTPNIILQMEKAAEGPALFHLILFFAPNISLENN